MKSFKTSIFVLVTLGALLFGCSNEGVKPTASTDKTTGLAGILDSVHPSLDTICKITQPIRFRSNDGSYNVNKKLTVGSPGCFTTITDPTVLAGQPEWGSFVLYNGYVYTNNGPQHWLDADFMMAPGWLCDFTDWVFTVNDDITIDQNTGFPIIGTDWSHLQINPLRNAWQVSILVNELPLPCFDMACRMSAVRLYLGSQPGGLNCIPTVPGAPNENTRTTLWAINEAWNDPTSELRSNNEFAVRYCPFGCLETTGPEVDSSCVTMYVGAPALGSCTNLTADTAGVGFTYAWSTGATTRTINVCPTANTTYTVTVSQGSTVIAIQAITVNYTNIACGNSNGNNGQHKVWVCHVPPGNPNNPQDICIDWSGVPAHVARFRVPGMNYRQGHDSGCEIGHCGGNPCD